MTVFRICGVVWLLISGALLLQACSDTNSVGNQVHQPAPEPAVINTSHYIPMPDGVRIAVDIWLPPGFNQTVDKVPAIMEITRYWRAIENGPYKNHIKQWNDRGFAYVAVDARGSGASFGERHSEFSVDEVRDYQHVIQWISRQPWNTGDVVSSGVSYSGNTSEYAMVDAPAALKASIPRFTDFDQYSSLFFPGGLANTGFVVPWGRGVQALDLNATSQADKIHPLWTGLKGLSVKPVDSDTDRSQLKTAAQAHAPNSSVIDLIDSITYRDDYPLAGDLSDPAANTFSPHLALNNPRVREIPSYHAASFFDAGTAAGALARFMATNAPMRLAIGYWTHGARDDTNPYLPKDAPVSPSQTEQYDDLADYARKLINSDETVATERAIYYYTAGEERWKKTDRWPVPGTQMQRWFFNKDQQLTEGHPTDTSGQDIYKVNFNAGTGSETRWSTQMGGSDVFYGDRAEADKLLLTYTSAPLQQAIEITGHPVISLEIMSDHSDGAVIAYLEIVAPDGTVTMLTEGQLRLLHRKVSNETPPYPQFGPYHSYLKKDAAPMPINQQQRVTFSLLPFSARIEAGYSLRIAIAGHDKDNFKRLPKEGEPTLTVLRQVGGVSWVELPVIDGQ